MDKKFVRASTSTYRQISKYLRRRNLLTIGLHWKCPVYITHVLYNHLRLGSRRAHLEVYRSVSNRTPLLSLYCHIQKAVQSPYSSLRQHGYHPLFYQQGQPFLVPLKKSTSTRGKHRPECNWPETLEFGSHLSCTPFQVFSNLLVGMASSPNTS